MQIGSEVAYENEIYVILWIYENGYCEIRRKKDSTVVKVAKLSELSPQE